MPATVNMTANKKHEINLTLCGEDSSWHCSCGETGDAANLKAHLGAGLEISCIRVPGLRVKLGFKRDLQRRLSSWPVAVERLFAVAHLLLVLFTYFAATVYFINARYIWGSIFLACALYYSRPHFRSWRAHWQQRTQKRAQAQ